MADITAEALKAFLDELQRVVDDPKIQALAPQLQTITDAFDVLESGLNLTPAAMEKVVKAMEKVGEKADEITDPIDRFDRQLKRTIQTFTGITEKSDTLLGSFFELAKQEDGLQKGFKQLGDTVKKTITPFNVATSSIQKLVEASVTLSLANDKAIASFNGATGAGGRFNQQILALEKSNRRFGIGAAEAGAALQNLIGGLSGFGLMADDTQTALADEVAELSKLGVAGSDTVGIFQSVTRTFGMTTDAAMDLTQEAEALAQDLGISVGQAVGDLNKALPQLAVLAGDEVEGAFKRLSEQAQETGLAIDQLTSIADRFMTFDQAGKAASNLNAVLGTQMFDTMSLLEAQLEGPQAFIDTFRDQLQGSVGDFDSLTVFQKQAIANAAGLSVVEVRNLMNAEALTDEQQEQARTREENLKAAMSLFDELQAVALQLTVSLAPAIEGFKTILDSTGRFLGFLGQAPYGIGAIAQIITLTLIPSLIKTVAQGSARLLMENRITMAIRRQTAALREQMMVRRGGGAPLNDFFLGGPGTPAPAPGRTGGRFSGFSGKGFGIGLASTALGAGIAYGAEEGSARDKAGGFLSGAGTGAMMGSMFGPGGAVVGGLIGGIAGLFADGTPDGTVTPKGPIVVGEKGPEVLMQNGGNKVLSNEQLADGLAGGGGDQAVVAAINNLSTKMDSLMQRLGSPGDFVLTVNRREFARLTNEHFGAPGSSPISGVG